MNKIDVKKYNINKEELIKTTSNWLNILESIDNEDKN